MKMMMMKIYRLTFQHLDGNSGDVIVGSQTVRRRLDNLSKGP